MSCDSVIIHLKFEMTQNLDLKSYSWSTYSENLELIVKIWKIKACPDHQDSVSGKFQSFKHKEGCQSVKVSRDVKHVWNAGFVLNKSICYIIFFLKEMYGNSTTSSGAKVHQFLPETSNTGVNSRFVRLLQRLPSYITATSCVLRKMSTHMPFPCSIMSVHNMSTCMHEWCISQTEERMSTKHFSLGREYECLG